MVTRIGTSRGETLRGTNGSDTLDGRGGDDTLLGLGGNDLLINGPGEDRLDGGPGRDTLRLHQGSLVLFDEGFIGDSLDFDSIDEVDRFAGIERVLGSEEGDEIEGDGADDELVGAGGSDGLTGNDGDDLLQGDDGDDGLAGNGGDDVLLGGRGRDGLGGGPGDDLVRAGAGDDRISDFEGDNRLFGDDGDDNILAGPGSDVLDGGRGSDFLRDDGTGNDSDDTFVVGSDAPDEVFLSYLAFEDDPDLGRIGDDRVRGFASGPAHVLDIGLVGILVEDGRQAEVDVVDFLDSNDDGRVTAADSEVARAGGDLVLDIDAVLTRALGEADYGTQQITLEGAGRGFAASRIEGLTPGTTINDPVVTENGIIEPPFTVPEAFA